MPRLRPLMFRRCPRRPSTRRARAACTSIALRRHRLRPPYFSPAPENLGIACADQVVIREALSKDNMALRSRCWQGFWCCCTHGLVFQFRNGQGAEQPWYLALHHFSDSAILAWEVVLRSPPGYDNSSMVYFGLVNEMPVALVATDLQSVFASRVSWHGWSWQLKQFPGAMGRWPAAVRGFLELPAKPILRVEAESGWWKLGRGVLAKVAMHLGISPASGHV